MFKKKKTNEIDISWVMVSPNVHTRIGPDEVIDAIERHCRQDWGNLCDHDKAQNERALQTGGRIFSTYRSSKGRMFWIITEGQERRTTVLMPEDY